MATIEARLRRDGSRAFRLKWRFGGRRGGAPQSVTYANLEDAKRMRGAVEALGHLVYAEDPRVVTFELVTGQRRTSYQAPTFGELAERYISSRTRASADSRDRYRHCVRSRLSEFVRRPIEAITDDDIRRVLNAITDGGGSARFEYELIGSVFKFAVNKGMLPGGNAAAFVEAPKKRGRTANFLSPVEAAMLVQVCRARNTAVGQALGDLVEVILATGLRISEALGLVVADVHVHDVEAAYLEVDQQLGRGRLSGRVPVKSGAGQRRIVLDAATARLLAALVQGRRPDVSVFSDPIGGGWWRQWRVKKAWSDARTAAQAQELAKHPRVHDLRHTHAAWLITDGVPLLAVSRRLGHESIKVTADVYGHLLPEADDAIRGAIGGRRAAMTLASTCRASARRGRRTRRTATAPPTRTDAGAPAATRRAHPPQADSAQNTEQVT